MTDLTILGAGIFGLSTAFECARRGARVQVIDPNGVGAGASGGVVGALAPHVPENWNDKKAFQFDGLILSRSFWKDVEAISGQSTGYTQSGRVQPVSDTHALDLAKSRAENAITLWQGKASWRLVKGCDTRLAPTSPTGWYIHDTLSAHIHPRQACNALATAVVALGGCLLADGAQKGIVLDATGTAGLHALSKALDRPVGTGVKGQAAVLDFAAPDSPQCFADTLHIIPHRDGTTAVGSTSERGYSDATSTDAQLDDLIEHARIAVPALAEAKILQRWAGERPRARSRAPMLGPHPLQNGQFIANGGFKIGFGIAPKVATVMADLMLEGHDAIPEAFHVQASL